MRTNRNWRQHKQAMATKLTPKDFVEALKDWTILDVVEAVKAIEDEFGIKAAAPVAVAAAPAAGSSDGAAAEEEKTEFTVNLAAVGESKINVIKAVRELTQLGLKEAKDLVDAAPRSEERRVGKECRPGRSQDRCKKTKSVREEHGATLR